MRRSISWWIALIVLPASAVACQTGLDPSLSSTSQEAAGSDRLNTGEVLHAGQAISAGGTALVYQSDNNLVLYQNGGAVWATMAGLGQPPNVFAMQGDCNAVVYSAHGPVWASNTSGQGGSCVARVIEGDWFVCSGGNRVFSARGGGSCGGGTPGFQCSEPSGAVPLPGIEHYRVRIQPDSLYVCDTLLGWDAHFPWPQPSPTETQSQCVGACGAGCSDDTCTRTGVGNYTFIDRKTACRPTRDDCYSTDCCLYHDLCGRMFPTAVFTSPFCHALAIVYGCVACIGDGFRGCSVGPSYTRTFDHPVTDTQNRECICVDPPGDCFNECNNTCWAGCDIDFNCFDDCTGQYVCGNPFCPDYCNAMCGGFGWCYYGYPGVQGSPDGSLGAPALSDTDASGMKASPDAPGAKTVPNVDPPDLEVRLGDRTTSWRAADLVDASTPLASLGTLTQEQEDGLGARNGWSLRDLVHGKLGVAATVVAVIDGDGKRVELDRAAWDSTDSTPILRVNRRGQLRFHWVGTRNRLEGMKNVRAIEVVLAPGPAPVAR